LDECKPEPLNKLTLFVVLLPFVAKVSSAQFPASQSRPVQVTGEIVYANKKVEPVKFEMLAILNGISVEDIENKIHYINEKGNRKILRPKDAEEIRFKWDEQDVRMVSRKPRHEATKKKFMRLLDDGRVRLYEYIKTYRFVGRATIDRARVQTTIYWYVERKDARMMMMKPLGFKKKMSKYFADCPKLAERIIAGAYKAIDAGQIVQYYNGDNCR